MNRCSRKILHGTVCAEASGSSAEAIGPRKLHLILKAMQGGLQAPERCRPHQHHHQACCYQVLAIYIYVFTSKVMWRRGREHFSIIS